MLATRPPIDLPPMMSAPAAGESGDRRAISGNQRFGARRRPAPSAAPRRHVAELETGHPQPRAASARAAADIDEESIGAPAPWASSIVTRASSGPSKRKSGHPGAVRASAASTTASPRAALRAHSESLSSSR